jgi:chromosome segregation ATPase
MKTIEELEAELETVTRERDKLSVLVELSDGYRRERDEARAALADATTEWKARRCECGADDFCKIAQERNEARAEVERLMHQLADQTNETTRARLEAKREADMLQDRLSEARAEVDRLTDERDELLVRVAEQGAELRATRESYNEARAECERLRTFAAQKFSAMIRQEAEQMRAYGLSYEGVRKVLHEYNDGEISFGKLMDLIRAAARAMAEEMKP